MVYNFTNLTCLGTYEKLLCKCICLVCIYIYIYMVRSVISTGPAPAYKPLRSHKLEIGGLVVWSVYPTNLHHDCRRPTLGRVMPSPRLSTSNPCMPRYKGSTRPTDPYKPYHMGHALPHLLTFTPLAESSSLPQFVRNSFPGPPTLIIMTLSPIYILSLHTRG